MFAHGSTGLSFGQRILLYFCVVVIAAGTLDQPRLVGKLATNIIQWTKPGIGGGDMYPPWFAARSALHGVDPYSPAVTDQIDTDIYGHPLDPGSPWAKQAFVYPAHFILILAPLTLLPWHAVATLLVILGLPAVALTTLLWLRVCQPEIRGASRVLIVALAALCWPSVSAMGCQPTVYIAALIAASVFLFQRSSDLSSGAILAVATVKPHLVLLLIAWLILVAARQRRFRFLAGFGVTLAVMLAASLVLVPHWIPQWIAASTRYAGKMPLLLTIAGHKPGTVLALALVVAVFVRIRKAVRQPSREPAFAWAVALLLAATVCLIPSSPWMIYNDLLLIPAVLVLLPRLLTTKPAGIFIGMAQLTLIAAILAAPLCSGLSRIFGYSIVFALTPSLICFVAPLALVPALMVASEPLPPLASMSGLLENAPQL
jgi:hypothetical protein